jgi:acetyl esterase/lipase
MPRPARRQTQTHIVDGMYSALALLLDVHWPDHSNRCGSHAPLGHVRGWLHHVCHQPPGSAVRFMRQHAEHFGICADRIGACGGSSGGHLVSLLGRQASACAVDGADPVNRQDASVQCLVARAPLVDLTRLVTGDGSGIVASFIGMPYCGEASDGYATAHRAHREASPLSHVFAAAPPCLLMHGDADVLAPYEQSVLMQAALKGVRVPVELLRIPGAGHGPDVPGAAHPPDYLAAMVAWLDLHLLQ